MDIRVDRITEAVSALGCFSGRDVAGLGDSELIAAQEAASWLLRLAEVQASIVATEAARRSNGAGGGLARRSGHRNAPSMVAHSSGGTVGQARELIAAGGLLNDAAQDDAAGGDDARGGESRGPAPRYPKVAAGFASGEISAAKAALVKQTLDQLDGVMPEQEERLVAKAVRLSLEDLRKACLQAVALWDQSRWEEREARIRAERFIAFKDDGDGAVHVSGRMDAASAAPIMSWLDAQVRAGFAKRRDDGLDTADPGEAGRMRVDALADLARHGMRCDLPGTGVSTTVVVRMDVEALRDGVGIGACDALSTPMSASQLRQMAVDARAIPVVLGGQSLPLDVGRALRFFTPAQRIALAERDGGCAFCHAPVAWTDAHHINSWSQTGRSDLSNGVLLCTRCHHRIHDDGWKVTATASEVWFTPPRTVDPEQRPRPGGRAALDIHPIPV